MIHYLMGTKCLQGMAAAPLKSLRSYSLQDMESERIHSLHNSSRLEVICMKWLP